MAEKENPECKCKSNARGTHCDLHGSCLCCHGVTCPMHDEPECYLAVKGNMLD